MVDGEVVGRTPAQRSKLARRKGKKFQKKVAAAISLWWTGSSDNFRSTPGSGGWDKNLAPGDIIAKKGFEEFPFTIECKKRKELTNFLNVLSPDNKIWDWWEQCDNDAEKSGKIPLLIFSEDFGDTFVLFLPDVWFGMYGFKYPWPALKLQSGEGEPVLYVSRLNDFLEANQPENVLLGYRDRYFRYRSTPEAQGEIWKYNTPRFKRPAARQASVPGPSSTEST